MAYRLYVDEVGNDDLGHVHEEAHQFLSLTGVAMNLDHARDIAVPALNKLKADIFRHDPEAPPIVFHRTDIVGKKGPFGVLADIELCKRFDDGLLKCLSDIRYTVVTVVIDKRSMMKQHHWNQTHPYHYLMEILVEKYAQWLERQDGTGDVMPEMRKGRKDAELQRAFERVHLLGTRYVIPKRIRDRLPSKNLKFRKKAENIAGLQICDLIAHPSYIYVRQKQGHDVHPGPCAQRIIDLLRTTKYDRSSWNVVTGYGIKYLP